MLPLFMHSSSIDFSGVLAIQSGSMAAALHSRCAAGILFTSVPACYQKGS